MKAKIKPLTPKWVSTKTHQKLSRGFLTSWIYKFKYKALCKLVDLTRLSVCQYGTRIDKRKSVYCMDTRVERIKTLRHLNALGCLMEFVVALCNLCFFWENEYFNLWSTFSCFNMCWRVPFIVRNKFGAVKKGLESKLAVTSIFPQIDE